MRASTKAQSSVTRSMVFSLPETDTLDIFGMDIDNKLNFLIIYHVALPRTLTRGSPTQTLQSVQFTSFHYCSSVWHFCGASDADKLEALNKRILRDVYLEIICLYTPLFFQKSTLLSCVTSAFRISSYRHMSLFFTHLPAYMKKTFSLRSSPYNAHGN